MACGGFSGRQQQGGLFVGKTSSYDLVRPGRRRVMALITGAGITAAMAVGVPAAASAATAAPMDLPIGCTQSGATVICTFPGTNVEQTFIVPADVSAVDITATGAWGGHSSDAGGEGEQAYAAGLPVTPGATLYVEVGAPGGNAPPILGADGPAGGWNGGGVGAASDPLTDPQASGGGASDVRTVSGGVDPATDALSLASRLIVGGGGGGAAGCGAGGDAGQPGTYTTGTGCMASSVGGGPGTAMAGGAAGGLLAAAGVVGLGGDGGALTPPATAAGDGGGGGGGGWYGGGGGGPQAGGGGGSSYVPSGPSNTVTLSVSDPSVSISYTLATLSIATHPNITVDATGPAGAVVHYTAPAVTDQANPMDPPKAVCVPPSGSTFAIGTTTVTCTAADAADYNSPLSTMFTVHVVGAPGQLAALYWDVRHYGPALANTVLIAEHAVNTENPQRACLPLDAFIIEVATRIPPLPPVTRAYLIAAAGQIRAVLGCGDSWLP
jgi:hypothetical protein